MGKFTASTWMICLVSSLLCAGFTGCSGGGADYPDLGTVSGVVTVDGKPTGNILVQFSPVDGGRTAVGLTDASGRYDLDYAADALAVAICHGATDGRREATEAALMRSTAAPTFDVSGRADPVMPVIDT